MDLRERRRVEPGRSSPPDRRLTTMLLGPLLASTLLLSDAVVAQEPGDYRLDTGDVLELSVTGIPDLRQRLVIDLDGRIQVPLAGDVPAAGSSVAELREAVRNALATSFYQQRLPNGGNAQLVISRDEVTLRVMEYRPIYLVGDVSRPGEQAYRAGMTVLQAVAMGGGYDIQRFRMTNPLLESADLRGDIEVLGSELARAQILVQRLEAELEGAATFEPKPEEVAVPPDLLSSLVRTETQQFVTRQADYRDERLFLQRLAGQTDAKLRTLLEQQQKEAEGAQVDLVETTRLRELLQRGIANTARVMEARQISLLSATRALQTQVEVEQTRKEKEELARRAEQVTTLRRSALLRELQEANSRAATAEARLAAAKEKAFFTGTLRSQLLIGRGARPQLTVVRQTADGRSRLAVDEDMQLRPGDVVEVALALEPSGTAELELPTD